MKQRYEHGYCSLNLTEIRNTKKEALWKGREEVTSHAPAVQQYIFFGSDFILFYWCPWGFIYEQRMEKNVMKIKDTKWDVNALIQWFFQHPIKNQLQLKIKLRTQKQLNLISHTVKFFQNLKLLRLCNKKQVKIWRFNMNKQR